MHHFDTSSFKDRNGERYMLPMRIKALSDLLLEKHVIRYQQDTGDFDFTEGDLLYRDLGDADWKPFRAGTDRWGKPDQ